MIIFCQLQYLTRPDTSDSGVDTGEEGIGGGGGSTSGGESSRAEKVIAYLKLSFCLSCFIINMLTYHVL